MSNVTMLADYRDKKNFKRHDFYLLFPLDGERVEVSGTYTTYYGKIIGWAYEVDCENSELDFRSRVSQKIRKLMESDNE